MKTYAMTGGATGIGAAIKTSLREAGHSIIVVDIKDADIVADLSTHAGRDLAIKAVIEAAPEGLDGFISCAGLGSHIPDLSLIANVNYYGTIDLVKGLKDTLALKRGGVVMISSNSAPMPTNTGFVDALLSDDRPKQAQEMESMEGQTVYSATKQAVARWMRRNTAEFAALGIRMNAVAPGYTETPMTAAVKSDPTYREAINQFLASIPIQRAGVPEDMANAVNFLLSDAASFVCGSVIFVDGGHDAMLRPDQF